MARKKKTKYPTTPVEAVTHGKDKRLNIPTAELADFAVKEEQAPYALRYPRDPSLDPQLVWKGKDEQDGRDLEVPAVPVYIQEHIKPQAIIEDLRRVQGGYAPAQAGLFDDFDGMQFSERIDFYRHAQNWTNRIILGDSLTVMTSLAEKEGLKGQVQMIYMDPPYGISFRSNWQVSTRKRDVRDGRPEDATREPEVIKAFRDTWKLGIHSYLTYWRDRLVLARELLTETGSIFVQIGDENVHLVRSLLDETFGSENFCALITFRKTSARSSDLLAGISDYIIWYAKNKAAAKFRKLFTRRTLDQTLLSQYPTVEHEDGTSRRLTSDEVANPGLIDTKCKLFREVLLTSSHHYSLGKEPIEFKGKVYLPGTRYWSTSPEGVKRLAFVSRLLPSGESLNFKRYLEDFAYIELSDSWSDTATGGGADRYYVVQTTPKVIERCMLMSTDPGDLVLDPTCGGGHYSLCGGALGPTLDNSRHKSRSY